MSRAGRRALKIILGLLLLAPALSLRAQEEPTPVDVEPVAATAPETPATGPGPELGRASLWKLVRQANPLLWPLVICSVVTVGFAFERLIALRRSRIVPAEFVDRFLDRLANGKLDQDRATELCRSNESPIARIFARMVQHWGQPASVIRDAAAGAAAGEILDMKRHARVLNGTATLSPLLGLLGTVFGMIEAFDALGNRTAAGVGKSEALAHGISLALMATAFGLVIAVVSVTIYYYLLNRIDLLVRRMDIETARVTELIAGDVGGTPRTPVGGDYRRGVVSPGDLARHDLRGI